MSTPMAPFKLRLKDQLRKVLAELLTEQLRELQNEPLRKRFKIMSRRCTTKLRKKHS
jgi:hypothetical protein